MTAIGQDRTAETVTEAPRWRVSLRGALPAWLSAHVLLLAALGIAAALQGGLPDTGAVRPASGLFVWDAGWYRGLAEHGYAGYEPSALRFFPLLPLAARALSWATGVPLPWGLLLICSAAGLAYGTVLHRLTWVQTGERAVAGRATWLSQLAPGAGVLGLPFTEAPAGLLAVTFFLLLLRDRTAMLVPVGLMCGLIRPTGFLICLPVVVRLLRPGGPAAGRARLILPLLAPPAGTLLYLGWCRHTHGDWLLPYRIQAGSGMRGGILVDPYAMLGHLAAGSGWARWPLVLLVGIGLTGLLLALGWLLRVVGKRLGADYLAWALPATVLAVTPVAFRSSVRYLASVFPLSMAAASLTRARVLWRPLICACLVGSLILDVAGFTPHYTW